jgi:hypothetical protein
VFTRVCAVLANSSVKVSFSVLGHTCYVTVVLPGSLVYFSECRNIIGDQILLESCIKLCRGKSGGILKLLHLWLFCYNMLLIDR